MINILPILLKFYLHFGIAQGHGFISQFMKYLTLINCYLYLFELYLLVEIDLNIVFVNNSYISAICICIFESVLMFDCYGTVPVHGVVHRKQTCSSFFLILQCLNMLFIFSFESFNICNFGPYITALEVVVLPILTVTYNCFYSRHLHSVGIFSH